MLSTTTLGDEEAKFDADLSIEQSGVTPPMKRTHSLALFRHQVAGHLPLFCPSDGTICKPAFPIEVEFYEHLGQRFPELLPFVPDFVDVVRMEIPEDKRERLMNDSADIINDWGKLLYEKHQKKLEKLDHRYIILEDLTEGVLHPCLLDLKLGTRQYGLNATPEKIASKTKKVNTTTSRTLGMRLCGFQTYHCDDDEFISKDKYYGRSLDDDDFIDMMYNFFHNGIELRVDCIERIISQLRSLYEILTLHPDNYIFYACSVLLVYEGSLDCDPIVDVRLIDFAHTHWLGNGKFEDDSGLLLGLENLIRILSDMLG